MTKLPVSVRERLIQINSLISEMSLTKVIVIFNIILLNIIILLHRYEFILHLGLISRRKRMNPIYYLTMLIYCDFTDMEIKLKIK